MMQTEMRAAKQQSHDLDHANTFLNSMIPTDGSASKIQPPSGDPSPSKLPNGRVRASRIDHAVRFGDPPAPPPSQPLPEKPDSARSSPVNTTSLDRMLRRSDTAKPTNGVAHSPSGSQNGQILSLVQALEVAKKDLDQQSNRVKQLEDMLKQEKSAREAAEQRARKAEESASSRPVLKAEEDNEHTGEKTINAIGEPDQTPTSETSEDILQQRIDHFVAEMEKLKADLDKASKRADSAEQDASNARTSLAEMIERLKKENGNKSHVETASDAISSREQNSSAMDEKAVISTREREGTANGHVRAPSRLPVHLERAMATVMRDSHAQGDLTAQSAPYVSMLGVVLIGVGLMAYLNSWQKGDK